MKSKRIKPLLLFPIFFLTFWYAGSSVYAENESQSPIHELPKANQCDVIIINIRELSFARKGVLKEISSPENPAGSALENNEYSQQQINEYEQRMKLLQERVSSLQKQIDSKEQQLQVCLQHTGASARKKD